jgi:hypothetical protein
MNFSDYASPPEYLKYSPAYFESLTFERAVSLDYPAINKPGLIILWNFDSDIPTTAAGTLVQPGELIPHASDLLPISRAMEGAFSGGSRSVVVTVEHQGQRETFTYHFFKVSVQVIWCDGGLTST